MKTDKTFIRTTRRLARLATRGLLLWLTFMATACGGSRQGDQGAAEDGFTITGAWELHELRFLSGQRVDVRTGADYIWYRFFEDTGTFYVAELSDSDQRKPVKPHEMSEYFFMMSPYDTVYISIHRTVLTINRQQHRPFGLDCYTCRYRLHRLSLYY